MRLTIWAATMAVIMAAGAVPAGAVSVRGGVSTSYYNHADDVSEHDRSVTRLKLRLDVDDFMAYDGGFHLRTITRSVSGKDYNDNLPTQRIDRAELEMRGVGGFMDLRLGRMNITDIFSTRVDGVNLDIHMGSAFGLGLFAGMTPDPFSDQVNSSYSTYGGYLFSRSKVSRFSLGYVSTAKGADDSTYLSGMYYSMSSRSITWIADIRFDEDKAKSQWRMTEAMVSGAYRPNKRAKVNFAYNEYRAIRLFDSMDFDANYDLQRSIRVGGDLFVFQRSLLYLRVDGRVRDIDNGTAALFTGGFRQDDMFDLLYMDLSFSGINYFNTSSSRFNFKLGADFTRDIGAEAEITTISTSQDGQGNDMNQLVLGASVDWRMRGMFVSAMLQYSNEEFLDVDSVYTNKASDHFAAVSFYLTVGYYF